MTAVDLPFVYRTERETREGIVRSWHVDVRRVDVAEGDPKEAERVSVSDLRASLRSHERFWLRGGRLHLRHSSLSTTNVRHVEAILFNGLRAEGPPVPPVAGLPLRGISGALATPGDPEGSDVLWTDYAGRREQALDYAAAVVHLGGSAFDCCHMQPVAVTPMGESADLVEHLELRDVVSGWRRPKDGLPRFASVEPCHGQAFRHPRPEREGGRVRIHREEAPEPSIDIDACAVVDAVHHLAEAVARHPRLAVGPMRSLALDVAEASAAVADDLLPLPDLREAARRGAAFLDRVVETPPSATIPAGFGRSALNLRLRGFLAGAAETYLPVGRALSGDDEAAIGALTP